MKNDSVDVKYKFDNSVVNGAIVEEKGGFMWIRFWEPLTEG
jgi:hypothetical protein